MLGRPSQPTRHCERTGRCELRARADRRRQRCCRERDAAETADPAAIDDCIEAVLGQLLTNAATRFPPPPASGSGSGSSAASPSP